MCRSSFARPIVNQGCDNFESDRAAGSKKPKEITSNHASDGVLTYIQPMEAVQDAVRRGCLKCQKPRNDEQRQALAQQSA